VFKVVPDEAHLVVDGKDMDPSVRSIPRPKPGQSVKVVVRADGFEDEPLTIDDSAPPSVDVWLSPVAKKEPPKAAAPAAPGDGPQRAAPSGGGGAKAPEPLLPNPY
jgi:hypothetical protein